MRTTLSIEPDVEIKLKKRMAAKNLSLKDAVNQALRAGLAAGEARPRVQFKVEPHACGFKAGIDLDKLNQLADELDADEVSRKLRR